MEHHNSSTQTGRPEAERLLGIAEKLLQNRDLNGSREFGLLAQEADPLLEGSDQILAITDVLIASERRVVNNRHHDWYAILQTNPHSLSSDPDLLKKNYRRLALLLHPDKNRYPLADSAFKLVADAWALLSDQSRRGLYDHELNVYDKVELRHQPPPPPPPQPHATPDKDKLPVRRSPRSSDGRSAKVRSKRGARSDAESKFWTACPYCYVLYQYPSKYEDFCLRCQNCERAFHASVIDSLPPMVPGKEAYYCCWGFFPLGFSLEDGKKNINAGGAGNSGGINNNNNNNVNAAHNTNSVFPNWMPAGMFNNSAVAPQGVGANLNVNVGGGGIDISDGAASGGFGNNNVSAGFRSVPVGMANTGPKKRGRPRKNP